MKEKWEYDNKATVTGIDGGNCRVIVADVYGKTSKEIDEHGKLIATAPKLLKACKGTLDIILAYQHIPAQKKACMILQNIIKKAEDK